MTLNILNRLFDDQHLLVNGVEILMFAFRPVGVYLDKWTLTLKTAEMRQYVETRPTGDGTVRSGI